MTEPIYAVGRAAGCPFCRRLDDIHARELPPAEHEAAIGALFDQANRAAHARRVYGRRKRGRW
ncbi:MAG: hypothetical protein M3N52_11900 [Actinomycetota bacterium]|nr:hypothetical protein [Actinomycetota bacterium]